MNTIIVIWSSAVGACLMLGFLYFLIWCRDRRIWANLVFAGTALSMIGLSVCELEMMHASTPEAFGVWLRWMHLPAFFVIAGMVSFIRFYFGTGNLWLGGATVGLRLVSLVVNFSLHPNINYREIKSIQLVPFLGEQVMIGGEVVLNRWMWLAQTSFVLFLLYALEATIQLIRRGDRAQRRRAWRMGGGVVFFVIIGMGHTTLALNQVILAPLITSMSMTMILFILGHELSWDVWRAAGLARDLQASERRLNLAASAARVALWEWRVEQDELWATPVAREFFATPQGESLRFQNFLRTVHPDDRSTVQRMIQLALEREGEFAAEFRRLLPDDSVRWIAGSGKMERETGTGVMLMRGVSVDITERRLAEGELDRQRAELEHLSRVTTLGELSGSLAHEINQPLAIILSNAQAAQRLLAQEPPDVEEVRDIMRDIVSQDQRAGDVIKRLRALLKRGQAERHPVALNEVVEEVLELMRSDLVTRGVSVQCELAETLPLVSGDRIPLQQVVLNLITNAADAMVENAPGQRPLKIASRREGALVRVSIRDAGCGLPPDPAKLFEPFFTTKSHGLGMGLPICRTIVTAHGGKLWAEPNPEAGATFHLEMPQREAAS